MTGKYDALLFLSFGGPEGMDDVMPFLANVLRGKNVPEARMKEVAHHYELFGGVSPINAQNRRLIAALESELKEHGIDLPVYFGNRNWHPMLADTLKEMAQAGVKKALCFVTSAYASYSGCRQYLEDIEKASKESQTSIEIDKLPVFFNHPLFIEANVDCIEKALKSQPDAPKTVQIAFTAHSIPMSMASGCAYKEQLEATCQMTIEGLEKKGLQPQGWSLVYQSRSGPPSQPWLEPDICDHLTSLAENGCKSVLVHPIGFVSDHMEIIYDLDTEASAKAKELGMNFIRSLSSGNSELFKRLMGKLVIDQIELVNKDPALVYKCPADCCNYTPVRPV